MKRVAVKFWRDLENNPKKIPPSWPARIRSMEKNEKCPFGWTEMSLDAVEKIKDDMRDEFELSLSKHAASLKDLERDAERLKDVELIREVKEVSLKEGPKTLLEKLKFWR